MTLAHEQPTHRTSLSGALGFAYGAVTYVFFLVTFVCAIGFIAGVPFMPKTIDTGPVTSPTMAVLIDLSLLGLFAVQHSVMARPAFKRWWTKMVPQTVERSTFVVASTLVLALLIWQWRPIADPVWHVSNPTAQIALWAFAAVGWAVLLTATFLINHFELFGLNQTFNAMLGRTFTPPAFHTPSLYKMVRHPLYLGFIIGFWSTPHMSVGHLLFAIGGTGYILVGIYFEERDLVAHFGKTYLDYQKRVPMLLPFGKRGN